MSEFKNEIISRCRTLIPVTFLWIKFTSNGTDGGLHFRFWILISALVVSEKMQPKNLQVFKFIIHLKYLTQLWYLVCDFFRKMQKNRFRMFFIATVFIETTFKYSKKVKIIRNCVLKCNQYLHFLI